MKIVINSDYGGYSLSKAAYDYLGLEWDGYGYAYENDRTNPNLVDCVETLGSHANGSCAALKVVEIPDDVKWRISGYDGCEFVEEVHRVWY